MKSFLALAALLLMACTANADDPAVFGDGPDYAASSARLYDVTSPAGHHCTVAMMTHYNGGIAMHCWN